MSNPLASSQWLYENLNNPDIVILDASLKAISSNKEVKNENIRIPGARYFDLATNFSDKHSDFPNTLPNATQFESECRKLGINKSSKIIVYDNLGIYSSPRVWWMLKTMGHQNVAVLNGGLPDWIIQGYKTEKIQPQEINSGNFKALFNSEMVKGIDFMQTNINTQSSIVIDARSAGRFNGTAPEPREGLRSGAIPNSLNIPFNDVLVHGKYKSNQEILEIFSKTEPQRKQIVYSCGSGLTACIILLASELVLPNKTAIYDGSWTEWAQLKE